jgi:hypothetical protein
VEDQEPRFQERFAELMDYRTDPAAAAGIIGADIAAGARRRARTRTLRVATSAAAVAALGLGALAVAGHAAGRPGVPAASGAGPEFTTAAAPAGSPVRHVAPGEAFAAAGGWHDYVTATQLCAAADTPRPQDEPSPQCKDVTGPNMAWLGGPARVAVQIGPRGGEMLAAGEFQGGDVPALIDVVFAGEHHTATIVETGGMRDWVAYYAQLPVPQKAATPGPKGLVTVTAYDAAGRRIAQIG